MITPVNYSLAAVSDACFEADVSNWPSTFRSTSSSDCRGFHSWDESLSAPSCLVSVLLSPVLRLCSATATITLKFKSNEAPLLSGSHSLSFRLDHRIIYNMDIIILNDSSLTQPSPSPPIWHLQHYRLIVHCLFRGSSPLPTNYPSGKLGLPHQQPYP